MNRSCSLEQIIQLMVVNGYRFAPFYPVQPGQEAFEQVRKNILPALLRSLSLWKTDIRALKNAFTKRSE